ncbi:hypothetical protein RIF29_38410 [Crotalaria pallida]|uniref:Uncharacterized protein n=1 Tax=Crotalaria pallida TaxID=3830 RepID=A0AAN9DZ58_CROPI
MRLTTLCNIVMINKMVNNYFWELLDAEIQWIVSAKHKLARKKYKKMVKGEAVLEVGEDEGWNFDDGGGNKDGDDDNGVVRLEWVMKEKGKIDFLSQFILQI